MLALSYSENPRNINFKIFNKTRSIDWGESFSIEPEDCYRDTKTENIREIIEEIRFGKPWKNVIEKKFKQANPWLYEIISSPKRTKFIDDFIKPRT